MPRQDKLPRTTEWIKGSARFAREDEWIKFRIQHPAMQQLRQALHLMGQASRDIGWTSKNDPKGKLKRAMEIVLELTSTAPK